MSSYAHPATAPQKIGGGFAVAVALHIAIFAALIGASFLPSANRNTWGGKDSTVGAIQASMVASIPLPPKAPPVEKAVLTSENVTEAPKPQPKDITAPPPKPTDLLIREKLAKTPPKVAPKEVITPNKHPQPVPDSPKATSGDSATQLPQSATPAKNGTAIATIADQAFGNRYAYYRGIVSRKVAENWFNSEADPRTSQGKRVIMRIDILRDGTLSNIQMETRSGSPSLDLSALHALQRIDSFGPLPAGDHVTVELTFDYHQP